MPEVIGYNISVTMDKVQVDAVKRLLPAPEDYNRVLQKAINAGKRAGTLMKWVNVGLVEGAVLVGVALIVDKKYRVPILLGAAAEAVITWAEYQHAKKSGLASSAPGTEQY